MPKIENIEITEEHIGCPVTYIPTHANGNINHPDCEHGIISSFNEQNIRVRYKAQCGANTPSKNLVWG